MSLITNTLLAFESAPLPDAVRRAAIQLLVSGARRHAASGGPEADAAFARQMALRPIAEHTDAANERSIRLLERLGFWQEGTFHDRFLEEDGYHDIALFVRLKRLRAG